MPMSRPLKWLLWTVGTLLSLAVVAILLMAWFLSGLLGEPSKDEVARIVSPSGNVEAVLFETNGGATTSFGYEVFVVERGAKPSGSPAVSLYGAVRNQHAYGANLKWSSPGSLLIRPDLSVNQAAYFTRASWKNFCTRLGDFSSVCMCSVAAAFNLALVRTGTLV